MFPRLPGRATFVADTKNVSDFVQKHFVSATNVSQFAQPKKHHGQQRVRNNVSPFTRALKCVYDKGGFYCYISSIMLCVKRCSKKIMDSDILTS